MSVQFMNQIDYHRGGSSCVPTVDRPGEDVSIWFKHDITVYGRLEAVFVLSIDDVDVSNVPPLSKDDIHYVIFRPYELVADCASDRDHCRTWIKQTRRGVLLQTIEEHHRELGITLALSLLSTTDGLSTDHQRLHRDYVTFPTCDELPMPFGTKGTEKTRKIKQRLGKYWDFRKIIGWLLWDVRTWTN